MAVAGYSEQEKIRQDQGEISHCCKTLRLLQVAGQQLHKTAGIKQRGHHAVTFRLRNLIEIRNDECMENYFAESSLGEVLICYHRFAAVIFHHSVSAPSAPSHTSCKHRV